ncbi:MAG: hypothetical protein L0Z55_07495, partial [Planctomycetes bacterium]|nr:hypothetical protein [Planctomycetota bacterium]
FDSSTYVRELLARPIVPPADPLDAPDLRTAARRKFESAGLFGDPNTAADILPAIEETDIDALPRSWKLPGGGVSAPSTILGDDTAFGPGVPTVPPVAAPSLADPITPQRDTTPADGGLRPPTPPPTPSELPALAPPPSVIGAGPVTPLQHPDAQTGLLLSAADSILRKASEVVARVFGDNPDVLSQTFDTLGAVIKAALPPEHHASVDKSTATAKSDAQQQIAERAAGERNRAAIGTLSERSAEAAREHHEAIVAGDPAKTAEARREAVQAWRAERIARGDSPSEVNASARAFDQRMRETALRHRLAQRDDAGLDHALEDDEDAKSDPAAQRIIDDIRRVRREDPARAGEASIAREIAQRKRDGRIDTPEEESRARYALRLAAQARRRIPEDQRRLFTNEERAVLLEQAEQFSSPIERERFITATVAEAGLLAGRARIELTRPDHVQGWPLIAQQASASAHELGHGGDAAIADQHEEAAEKVSAGNDEDFPRSQPEDDPHGKLTAEQRREPEPPVTSYSVDAEMGTPHPVSPLRQLRGLIGRLYSVSALKDDGTPVVSDQDVAAYLDEARRYIKPEHRAVFELSVLAVRTGTIPYWRAVERLRDHYAPESTGETILGGILDFIPIVGQVKGGIEIGEALDGLRIAIDEGDQAGATKFAADAALLLAGLVPLLKAGKFAKHIPGLEKLKDILGEFAGGRLPFHEFLEKWNKNWKIEGHHSFPIFLGGQKRKGVAELRANVHRDLHRELNALLRGTANAQGKHMRPLRGNSGERIRENFRTEERARAMVDFYTGPGNRLRYRNARREFFRLFPELVQ